MFWKRVISRFDGSCRIKLQPSGGCLLAPLASVGRTCNDVLVPIDVRMTINRCSHGSDSMELDG